VVVIWNNTLVHFLREICKHDTLINVVKSIIPIHDLPQSSMVHNVSGACMSQGQYWQ